LIPAFRRIFAYCAILVLRLGQEFEILSGDSMLGSQDHITARPLPLLRFVIPGSPFLALCFVFRGFLNATPAGRMTSVAIVGVTVGLAAILAEFMKRLWRFALVTTLHGLFSQSLNGERIPC